MPNPGTLQVLKIYRDPPVSYQKTEIACDLYEKMLITYVIHAQQCRGIFIHLSARV
jgi:hypothetical protein